MKKKDTKNKIFKERIIKIYDYLVPLYKHSLYGFPDYKKRSYIRLRGKWVEDLGFKIGLSMRVITFDRCIIFIVEEEESF